ncbi:MAG TPA: Maf family protein, partial [Acidocella sp.]|nr:Maf family protein [Acidocella sp.]
MPLQVILASASPRRLDLLRQIGIEPDQIVALHIDETPQAGESPRAYALRMALQKLPPGDGFVIAADTVVAAGARILPKAETLEQAEKCLLLLSGRRHKVYTAVAVRAPDGRVVSRVVA